MIINIKVDLMESDYSMCLAHLLNYRDNVQTDTLLRYSLKIKEKINSPAMKMQSDFFNPGS